jgi:excisionase family DNA binding protein
MENNTDRLTKEEASEYSKLPIRTLVRLVSEGKLHVYRLGFRTRFYSRQDIDNYFNSTYKIANGGK